MFIPPLSYYEKQIEDKQCKRCKIPLGGLPIQHYDHEGGYDVHTFYRKQWLYVVCPMCEYQWALHKLGAKAPQVIDFSQLPRGLIRHFDSVNMWDRVHMRPPWSDDATLTQMQHEEIERRGLELGAYLALYPIPPHTTIMTAQEFVLVFVPAT